MAQPCGDGMGCTPCHARTVGWVAVASWMAVFVQFPVSGSVQMVSIATWPSAELIQGTGPEILHFSVSSSVMWMLLTPGLLHLEALEKSHCIVNSCGAGKESAKPLLWRQGVSEAAPESSEPPGISGWPSTWVKPSPPLGAGGVLEAAQMSCENLPPSSKKVALHRPAPPCSAHRLQQISFQLSGSLGRALHERKGPPWP